MPRAPEFQLRSFLPSFSIIPALFFPEKFGMPGRCADSCLSPRCPESLRSPGPSREGREEAASPRLFPADPCWAENKQSVLRPVPLRATGLGTAAVSHYGTRPYRIWVRRSFLRRVFGVPSSFIFFGPRVASPSDLKYREVRPCPGCGATPATEGAGCGRGRARRSSDGPELRAGQYTDKHQKIIALDFFSLFFHSTRVYYCTINVR